MTGSQSEKANSVGDNAFAMPAMACAVQCFGKYADDVKETRVDNVPPNAMIRFDSNPSQKVLVDIFDVRATDDGNGYVMTFRQLPSAAADNILKEGECHPIQLLSADGITEHYHHNSTCMETILDWNIEESVVEGDGMMAFVKDFGCSIM